MIEILRQYRAIRLGYFLFGNSGVAKRLKFRGSWRLRLLVHRFCSYLTKAAVPGWYDTHARHRCATVGKTFSSRDEGVALTGSVQMGIWSSLAAVVGKKIDCKSIRPIVSFTFDDAPLSSFTIGGKILEEHGFRGTYYVSAGLLDYTSQVGKIVDIETLHLFHERGHEIGNHTYDHMDCQKASLLGILKSVRRNRRRLTGIMSGSFAYPYGARNARSRVAARLCASSARGISFGINKNVVDLMDLKAARVYRRDSMDDCLELVSECARRGGWLIFYTHDVCDEPSDFGCTPEQFNRLVRAVHENKLTVATVGKALQLIEQGGGKKGCFVNQESQGDRLCH